MLTKFYAQAKPACLMFLWLSVLTGLAYPLAVTALGSVLFPSQAGGSLLLRQGAVVGSALIGQPFSSGRYFQGRPSATTPFAYNAASSSGSNLGPSNPALRQAARERVAALGPTAPDGPVPMDLATASGSGLDPHISPEAATWQIDRVAKARGLSRETVAALVARQVERPLWGFWGTARVNVLRLNCALDALDASK